MTDQPILIVEDNEKNLKLLHDVLHASGYKTLEAGTAEDGIVLARQHKPALILMDIGLPGMDGITALTRLKQDAVTQAIPIIAVTASAMPQERERILAAGFAGYHAKPINYRTLLTEIKGVLDS